MKNLANASAMLMENGQQASQHQQSTSAPQQHSKQQHIERSYYNPSRRKAAVYENRASTYDLNRYQNQIIGRHNGCPWRPAGHIYPPGVVGYVSYLVHHSRPITSSAVSTHIRPVDVNQTNQTTDFIAAEYRVASRRHGGRDDFQ